MSGTTSNGRARRLTVNHDAQAMIDVARDEHIETVWDRLEAQQPQCGYCALGLSCRNCAMGPCRIDPFGEGPQKGVCGADADVIVARNLGRTIAAGSSSHSDHGRDILETFAAMARGETTGYRIADEDKLRRLAAEVGVTTEGRSAQQVAVDLSDVLLDDYGTRRGTLSFTAARPEARRAKWDAARHHPPGHRPGERRDAPPDPHGRRQRLRQHAPARPADGALRRVGRLDDRHRALRRHVRHARPR